MRRKLQFSLLSLLILMTLAALLAAWLRPRYVNVQFTFVGLRPAREHLTDELYTAAIIRVTNRSSNPLWCHGSGTFLMSQKVENKWIHGGYAQSPETLVKLRQGESLTLHVPLYEDAEALRIGKGFFTNPGGESVAVWSEVATSARWGTAVRHTDSKRTGPALGRRDIPSERAPRHFW